MRTFELFLAFTVHVINQILRGLVRSCIGLEVIGKFHGAWEAILMQFDSRRKSWELLDLLSRCANSIYSLKTMSWLIFD